MSTTADTPPLVVRRTLGAPLALVYRAWSEPELAACWSWRRLDQAKVEGTRTGWEGVLVAVESCLAAFARAASTPR